MKRKMHSSLVFLGALVVGLLNHRTLAFGGSFSDANPSSQNLKMSMDEDVRSGSSEQRYAPPFNYTFEVVGAFGRIGSFWLCHGDAVNGMSSAAAVPRGLAPGCLTNKGCPIYVATPSQAWQEIWNLTVKERRVDLVFIGNGIPPTSFESATFVVPHFSILTRCQRNETEPCIQTNKGSPKTVLCGSHASMASQILQKHGVDTEIVGNYHLLKEAAARKLLWASCMWLLCRISKEIKSVGQVHEKHQLELIRLVDELLPSFEAIVGKEADREEVLHYLETYSLSIYEAVPNLDLAVAELEDRNGVWLSRKSPQHPQVYHQTLLKQIIGGKVLDRLLSKKDSEHERKREKDAIRLRQVKIVCSGKFGITQQAEKEVIIVGGGIIGTSTALSLIERRPDLSITVVDCLSAEFHGKTTPASWAWLNANQKSPKSYQLLNQLGIHAWKNEPRLKGIASWLGSLVRFEDIPAFVNDGGYPIDGPLSHSQIIEREPMASWQLPDTANKGATFFFGDEGCVDPTLAVKRIKAAAVERGVIFISDANVTKVNISPDSQQISGVTISQDGTEIIKDADTVIVAAGIGSASKSLGCNLQLLHRPGSIMYTNPTGGKRKRLSHILVDPLRSSHVLQRPDGTIVAGGGTLEVGGPPKAGEQVSVSKELSNRSLLDRAKALVPELVSSSGAAEVCEAVRPMPLDGLPVVGYVRPGLYVIVTHSGITLGPLLSNFGAAEIAEGFSCDILSEYRPARFGNL